MGENYPFEYRRGYRDGLRRAVTWLHDRAKEMNDPHAVAILHSAATNLGWDVGYGRVPIKGEAISAPSPADGDGHG